MNDFNDGIAFLVIGNDNKKIVAASGEDSFSDVRQSELSIQKILLDSNVDGNKSYSKTIDYLEKGTYWYRTCVQYEDEDEYNRTKNFLRCSDTASLNKY